MPREASRQPQGEVQGTRNFVDDVNQQRRDERDELKRALEQSMVEELHRQKKHAEDLQRQHDEMEKKNEELQKELKKKSSSVEPPRTPPRRPQYYSLSPQTRTTPGGTQVPPGQPPLDPIDLPELPPWQLDPFAVDEHVGGGTGFDGLEDFWTPVDQQPRPQQYRPQPGADRFAWLENDVRMRRGERPMLTGECTGSNRCTDMVAHQRTLAMFRNHQHNHLKTWNWTLWSTSVCSTNAIWPSATAMATTSTTSKRS